MKKVGSAFWHSHFGKLKPGRNASDVSDAFAEFSGLEIAE